jgi:hypothetical protein
MTDIRHVDASERVLPAAYQDLATLAARWARGTELMRGEIRLAASAADFAEFYDAMMPRLDAILDQLSQYQLNTMPSDVRYLFDLTCAFAEASPHHELYSGSAAVPHSFDAKRFVPGHSAFAD